MILHSLFTANGTLVLGASGSQLCPEDESDDSRCQGIFSGELSDLNVWSRLLDREEVDAFTGCREEGRGDTLSWGEARWRILKKKKIAKQIPQK